MTEETKTLNMQTIQANRLQRQFQLIKQKHQFDIKQFPDGSKLITFYMNVNKLNHIPLIIHLPKQYPFTEPLYTFQPPEGYLSKDNYGIKKQISVLLGEWNPGMRLSNIADDSIKQIEKGLVNRSTIIIQPIYDSLGQIKNVVLFLLFSLFVRVLVGLGSYSGQGNPPNFGDFQAQRNWMSISWNRPIQNWYTEINQKPWWRLDYPPVAGYLSYICAVFMKLIHPQGLQEVLGYQDISFKSFMRMTVIFTDVITFFIPVVVYHHIWKVNTNFARLQGIFLLLLPPFILIDHGHFQYNCIMIGLVLAGYTALIYNKKQLTCFLFTIALSTKQMSMYYALGFFSILLGKAMHQSRVFNNQTFKFYSNPVCLFRFVVQICKYGGIVLIVTLILWSPWISWQNPQLIFEPLSAIFPIHRGLYQLKVPNFWCVTDVFMKWETKFSNNILVILCALLSLITSIPSILIGIVFPNNNRLTLLVFLNISLTFFFFSYHVHQKTILVPLLFVGLSLHYFGKLALDFVMISSFVMYHLLKQDGLTLQYFVCNIAFLYFTKSSINTLFSMSPSIYLTNSSSDIHPLIFLFNQLISSIQRFYPKLRKLILILVLVLHFCDGFVTPPQKLPYLFHLLFSTLGFMFFLFFWIISNIRMIIDASTIYITSKKKKTQ